MDPAEAAALAAQVSGVVGAVIVGVIAGSAAGVIPPGPGAMAIIGQVQVLSQIGKVGGGSGALGAFSEGFAWANGDVPFSLFSEGNGEAAPDSSATRVRRWMHTARRSSRRLKKSRPNPGQTGKEAEDPDCSNATMTQDEKSECRECGIIDGVPLMDKLFLVFFSMVIVSGIRALGQLIITRCMKKDPWEALMFPNWEGPLLITHWFSFHFHATTPLRCFRSPQS